MCVWRQVGEGGRMETLSFLCLLSISEKIFVFLWFWIWFLTLSSLVYFLYYAMLAVARYSRYQYFIIPSPESFKYLVPRGLTHSSRAPGQLMMSDEKKEQKS